MTERDLNEKNDVAADLLRLELLTIHNAFNKSFLSIYYVRDIVVDAEETAVHKVDSDLLSWTSPFGENRPLSRAAITNTTDRVGG